MQSIDLLIDQADRSHVIRIAPPTNFTYRSGGKPGISAKQTNNEFLRKVSM